MTNEDATALSGAKMSTAARIGWCALIAVTLGVCYFSNLGALGFVGPDEPRYAWIARDMAESGDWVTPRLYGKPWFEKPALYYWMAGASFKLFGVSEAAARLPSAFCALFATLALAWLSWRVYGAETARWLLLLLPTSVGMIGFSHAAATDMPFSAMLTIAMVCAAAVLGLTQNENTPILPHTPWIPVLLFGFFLGLAVLAKGPAAIILCGGAVFFWALFTKKWRDAFRLLHPVAIISFCATALPWYILCSRRNPDFFRIFIIEHNFKRYLTPEFQHIQPFWYYVPILLAALLPWAIPFIWVAFKSRLGFSKESRTDHLQLLVWLGALFCFLFFSVSKSKLPGYVLPAVPLLVFIASREFSLLANRNRRLFYWLHLSNGLILCAAGVWEGSFSKHPPPVGNLIADGIGLLLTALAIPASLVACSVGKQPRPSGVARAYLPVSVAYWVLIGAAGFALHLIDPSVSSRQLAREILTEQSIQPEDIRAYRLQRALAYQLNFYLRSELQEFAPGDPGARYIICSRENALSMSKSGVRLRFRKYGSGGVKNEELLYEIVRGTLPGGSSGRGQVH